MKTIYKISAVIAVLLAFSVRSFAAGEFRLPEYSKVTLKNGITLYLMEQHEVPLVDVNVIVTAGATRDASIPGLASMTADNLLFGTSKQTKAEFEFAQEFVGAEFSSQATKDYSQISASFAKKDSAQMLSMIADVIQRPRLPKEEFEKYQQRQIGNLKQRKESPRSVINDYYSQLVFAGHPYNAVVEGTVDAVEKATIDDIKLFYTRFYVPENIAIAVVGDFDSKSMKKQVEKLFGGWERANKEKPITFPELPNFTSSKVLMVNKSDARESTFLIGGKGIASNNPDYVPLSVINTILGARFTSWLNDELRVNSGLTYGARSRFDSLQHAGSFYISTFTKTETTEQAIDLALSTYARLWEQGIDDATLKSAKSYVKGQFPPRYETSRELAALLGQMHVYELSDSYINDFQKSVDNISIEDTKRLIAKYFPKENLQFTVVGKAEDIRDMLKKYGDILEVDITTPGFNIQ